MMSPEAERVLLARLARQREAIEALKYHNALAHERLNRIATVLQDNQHQKVHRIEEILDQPQRL